MASTITNLINTIDTGFPVAGQDNDSQGFRNNFSIIQQSLLATQGEIDGINNVISALGGTTYSTATHVHALQDVKIGTTNSVTLSVNSQNQIVAQSTSSSIVLVGVSQTVQAQVAYALTDSPTDSVANMFALSSVDLITVGATVTIGGGTKTVTAIDPATNYVTVTPNFTVPSFAVGDTLTFTNPFTAPTGDLYINGNITGYAGNVSDAGLKDNVATLEGALEKVKSLRGVSFDWKDEYLDSLGFPEKPQKHDIGLIAQEVKEVLPEVVVEKSDGLLTVKYEKLVSVLIESVKALSDKVDELQNRLDNLDV